MTQAREIGLLREVRLASRDLALKEELLKRERFKRDIAIRQAIKDGTPKGEVAKAVGLSRVSIWKIAKGGLNG